MENNIDEFYENISPIYDKIGISDYSITFGKNILKFFESKTEEYRKNLDFCCGTGALCNFFEKNGIHSKGVDFSEDMINIACEKYPEIEFVKADIIEYEDREKYDFITCIDDALNHIYDIEDFKTIIKNANGLLRSGGYLIFDLNIPDFFPEYVVKGIDNESKLTFNFKIIDSDSYLAVVSYFENDELIWKCDMYERVYNLGDVCKILNENGFVVELCTQEFFDDKRHEKYKFIARKGNSVAFKSYEHLKIQ